MSRAKADLGRLQQEESQLEQSLAAGKVQLETIIKSLKATQDEINQVGAGWFPTAASRGRLGGDHLTTGSGLRSGSGTAFHVSTGF